MVLVDDELILFEAVGPTPLPISNLEGHVEHAGAKIWYSVYSEGKPKKDEGEARKVVVFLHGGLGNSQNWGYQVPQVVHAGYIAVLIDSRGHGRSTIVEGPLTFELLAADVLAVLDALRVHKVALIGWSDGSCISLTIAKKYPERISGVFFFAGNMDLTGVKDFESTPIIERCFSRHTQDYAELSATPTGFPQLLEVVTQMQQKEPNFTKEELGAIQVPVLIVQSENDEFIKEAHSKYLKESIPNSGLTILPGVSHFAPLQRPELFNHELLAFLRKVMPL